MVARGGEFHGDGGHGSAQLGDNHPRDGEVAVGDGSVFAAAIEADIFRAGVSVIADHRREKAVAVDARVERAEVAIAASERVARVSAVGDERGNAVAVEATVNGTGIAVIAEDRLEHAFAILTKIIRTQVAVIAE